MALISAKNLVTPLTNKIHLTAIILVVVAFAFLRLSGGRIDFESAKKSGKSNKSVTYTAPEKPKGSHPGGAIRDESISPFKGKSDTVTSPNNSGKSKSFDDIEKLFQKK